MTKVTSKNTISFPQFAWGIHAGDERELPSDKEAQEAILAHPDIEEVGKSKSQVRRASVQKDAKSDSGKTN